MRPNLAVLVCYMEYQRSFPLRSHLMPVKQYRDACVQDILAWAEITSVIASTEQGTWRFAGTLWRLQLGNRQ